MPKSSNIGTALKSNPRDTHNIGMIADTPPTAGSRSPGLPEPNIFAWKPDKERERMKTTDRFILTGSHFIIASAEE